MVFGFFLAAGWGISAYNTYSELLEFEDLLQLTSRAGGYMHETQKERDATGVYLESGGSEFRKELDLQRAVTDLASARLKEYWLSYDVSPHGEKLKNALEVVKSNSDDLGGFRGKVDTLTLSPAAGVALYSEHNASIISLVTRVAEECGNFEDRAACAAYASFLQGKEDAGRERAVMAVVFARDQFEIGELQLFASLVTEQEMHFNSFLNFSSEAHIELYQQQLTGAIVDEVQRMRNIAFNKGESSPKRIRRVQLLAEFGLGGFIHNFKNYVLRNDEVYEQAFQENYIRASRILDDSKGIATTEQEIETLVTIQNMMDSYKRNIELVRDAHLKGLNTVEIDRMVKVDDNPALAALQQLSESVSYGAFSIDASHWITTMTQKIDLLKTVEERLMADLLVNAAVAKDRTQLSLILVSLLTLIITITVARATYSYGRRRTDASDSSQSLY